MKWEKVQFGEVVDVLLGGTPTTTNSEFWNGDIPWASVVDFLDTKKIYNTERTITELGLEKSNTKLLNIGDLILSARGTVGKVVMCGRPMAFNQSCYALRTKNTQTLSQDFLYYLTKTIVAQLKQQAVGGVFDTIIKKTVEEVYAEIPPLPTQRKIAGILSAYDDLIENNLKRIKLLEEKAMMRYKQIVREEKFLQRAFNDVAHYINGYPFKPDDWRDEGLPIIKIKELKGGVQHDTPRNDGENIPEKYFIGNKDILFAWSASIGAYFWCSGKSILNQHIFNVKPFDKDLHNWLYFSLVEKIPDFINLSNGATMQHIKKSALGMVYLPVPPKKVYQEFQNETGPMLDLVVNLNQQNAKLREARDILLPRLMNGEIEV